MKFVSVKNLRKMILSIEDKATEREREAEYLELKAECYRDISTGPMYAKYARAERREAADWRALAQMLRGTWLHNKIQANVRKRALRGQSTQEPDKR